MLAAGRPRAPILAFPSNDLTDMPESCANLARSVIRALPRKKPAILLVDETGLRDRLKAMVVSVAYEGWAIPVAAWTRRAPIADGTSR